MIDLEGQGMVDVAMVGVAIAGLIAVAGIAVLLVRDRASTRSIHPFGTKLNLDAAVLDAKFSRSTGGMAQRLSDVKGELRQETADRIGQGFLDLRIEVERQLKAGREEQAGALKLEIAGLT